MSTEKEEKPGRSTKFKKGQVANPTGRPKGVANKVTTQMRETMYNFYMGNVETLQSDFDAMEAKDRMILRVKLLPFFMPTMTATKAEKTINHTGFEHMTTKQLRELLLTINPKLDAEDIEHTEAD